MQLLTTEVLAIYRNNPPSLWEIYPKRGGFFDFILPSHDHSLLSADRRDPAHGQTANRTDGAIGIRGDHAGS